MQSLLSVTPAHSNDLCLQSTIIEYDVVLRSFRNRILGLPRESFVIGEKEITEIQWSVFHQLYYTVCACMVFTVFIATLF